MALSHAECANGIYSSLRFVNDIRLQLQKIHTHNCIANTHFERKRTMYR